MSYQEIMQTFLKEKIIQINYKNLLLKNKKKMVVSG